MYRLKKLTSLGSSHGFIVNDHGSLDDLYMQVHLTFKTCGVVHVPSRGIEGSLYSTIINGLLHCSKGAQRNLLPCSHAKFSHVITHLRRTNI